MTENEQPTVPEVGESGDAGGESKVLADVRETNVEPLKSAARPAGFFAGIWSQMRGGDDRSAPCGSREISVPAPQVSIDTQDAPAPDTSPMAEDLFKNNVTGLLRIWAFRRSHFEQKWRAMQEAKFRIETEYKQVQGNPLILRAMEDMRLAGDNEAESVRVSAELRRNTGDRFSEYARNLRVNVENMNFHLGKLRQNSKMAFDAAASEPLDRWSCPESVEKDIMKFLVELRLRPELSLIRNENGRSLRDWISALIDELASIFEEYRKATVMAYRAPDTGASTREGRS